MAGGGCLCPSRGPRHHVGPAQASAMNHSQKSAVPTCKAWSQCRVYHESQNPFSHQEGRSSHISCPRFDEGWIISFIPAFSPTGFITPALTQPLPQGSANGNASEIIQPSTSQSQHPASLINGCTKTYSKTKITQTARQANNPSSTTPHSEITEVPR